MATGSSVGSEQQDGKAKRTISPKRAETIRRVIKSRRNLFRELAKY